MSASIVTTARSLRLAEFDQLGQAHHLAVVRDDLADRANRDEPGEFQQVDRRLGVAGAGADPAVQRAKRQDVAGPVEAGRRRLDVGEHAQRVRALRRADAGALAVGGIHRDRVRGLQRVLVVEHHERQLEPVGDLVASSARR